MPHRSQVPTSVAQWHFSTQISCSAPGQIPPQCTCRLLPDPWRSEKRWLGRTPEQGSATTRLAPQPSRHRHAEPGRPLGRGAGRGHFILVPPGWPWLAASAPGRLVARHQQSGAALMVSLESSGAIPEATPCSGGIDAAGLAQRSRVMPGPTGSRSSRAPASRQKAGMKPSHHSHSRPKRPASPRPVSLADRGLGDLGPQRVQGRSAGRNARYGLTATR